MDILILQNLISNLVEGLHRVDLLAVECLPFIFGTTLKYRDQESLRKDVVQGNVSLYIEVEAILGDDVWKFMEREDEAFNSED